MDRYVSLNVRRQSLLFLSIVTLLPVLASAQTYCSATSNDSRYEYIKTVQIGSLSNTSSADKYKDYSSMKVLLQRGSTVNLSLTPGFSGRVYSEKWAVFVDYNGNGNFADPGEMVASGTTPGTGPLIGSFTVPA